MRPKLYIIGCNGIPARYGGFETFAEYISKELSNDYDITVTCSKKTYSIEEQYIKWGEVNRKFIGLKGNGIQSLLYDYISLRIAASKADHIIILGVGAALFLPLFPILKNKKVLVHIDGLEWKRKKWNLISKLILKIGFQFSVKESSTVIIDNIALSKYIPTKYHRKLRHITYGGDHLPSPKLSLSPVSKPFALMIARAEPENNLSLVIETFETYNSLPIIIVSNWNQTLYGRKILHKYEHHPNIILTGPIYDVKELQQYREQCLMYIHGHSAGGTNPSLIEAMYMGKPIIAWDNEFNRITMDNRAVYFKNPKELLIQLANHESPDFALYGIQLKQYAQANYKWSYAAEELRTVFKSDHKQ